MVITLPFLKLLLLPEYIILYFINNKTGLCCGDAIICVRRMGSPLINHTLSDVYEIDGNGVMFCKSSVKRFMTMDLRIGIPASVLLL